MQSLRNNLRMYSILLEGLVGGCREVGEMAVRGEQQETLAVAVLSSHVERLRASTGVEPSHLGLP